MALDSLPDRAVDELDPGDVAKFTVVRVGDEIVIDLMKSASGIEYAEASNVVVIRTISGVDIPFASPRLLWRKKRTRSAKKMRLICSFCGRGSRPDAERPRD